MGAIGAEYRDLRHPHAAAAAGRTREWHADQRLLALLRREGQRRHQAAWRVLPFSDIDVLTRQPAAYWLQHMGALRTGAGDRTNLRDGALPGDLFCCRVG